MKNTTIAINANTALTAAQSSNVYTPSRRGARRILPAWLERSRRHHCRRADCEAAKNQELMVSTWRWSPVFTRLPSYVRVS